MYAVNFGSQFLLFLTRSKSNSKSLQKGNLARLIELFDSGPGLHPVPKLRNKVLYCCSKRVHCQLFYFEIEFSLDKVLRTYFKEKLLLVEQDLSLFTENFLFFHIFIVHFPKSFSDVLPKFLEQQLFAYVAQLEHSGKYLNYFLSCKNVNNVHTYNRYCIESSCILCRISLELNFRKETDKMFLTIHVTLYVLGQ